MQETTSVTDVLHQAEIAETTGDYEYGLILLKFFWNYTTPDAPPDSGGLTQLETARLLLRCGALYGFYGLNRIDAQETSKNLLTTARELFEILEMESEQAFCLNYLAISYWRMDQLEEAKTYLNLSLDFNFKPTEPARLHSIIVKSMIFITEKQYEVVAQQLGFMKPFFDKSGNLFYIAVFYMNLALAKKNLGENSLPENLKARELFIKIKNLQYLSSIENNIAHLKQKRGEIGEAFQHAYHALHIAKELNDFRYIGCVKDTLAQLAIDAQAYPIALIYVNEALEFLYKTESYNFLLAALKTKMEILLRLEKFEDAFAVHAEAVQISQKFTSSDSIKQLTSYLASYMRGKLFVKVYEEGTVISQYKSYELVFDDEMPDGELSAVTISSKRFEHLGLSSGMIAVVADTAVEFGDFVAVVEKNSGRCYFGFFGVVFGRVILESGGDLRPFNFPVGNVRLLGKVVGVSAGEPDEQDRLFVKNFDKKICI